jgi:hypothetical protein
MRFVNDVRRAHLGETGQGHVEGVVRVRGLEGGAGGRRFVYQRYDPEAIVVRGEDDLRRLPLDSPANNLPMMLAPVAAYAVVRLMYRRRRRR